MFDNLTGRLSRVAKTLAGQHKLSEKNIKSTLRDVRMALLEADVALPVVKNFITRIEQAAVGQQVMTGLNPGQALIQIVNDELTQMMGEACETLNLRAAPPAVILMAGLQGSGKTTTVGKLAHFLKQQHNKKVMVTSCDIYRPAAIDQLNKLAQQVDVAFHPSDATEAPVAIATAALKAARTQFVDVLIVDTAGRLHIDDEMMGEIQALHGALTPVETLFVVDSMTGQDAANTARAFNDALPLTGVILTKTDGDARGGAALSIRALTGKPIKFLGVGEKIDALQPFHPDRVASRILGMGDVLSLIEEAQQKVDQKQAVKLAKKITTGQRFTLDDFKTQLEQMQNMGGMSGMLDKLPGMADLPDAVRSQVNDQSFQKLIVIINSMTQQEKIRPDILNGSRKRRIAKGSGTQVPDINKLLKQFKQMQKMMQKFKGGGMGKMMRGLAQVPGMGKMMGSLGNLGGLGGGDLSQLEKLAKSGELPDLAALKKPLGDKD